jgi:hypothetical protein
MAGNSVVLDFTGNTKELTDSFDQVGSSSKKMGDSVGGATKELQAHEGGLSKVGEAADNSERNLIGVHDVIDGTATIMKGPGKQGIVAYIQGWADLAGGLAPLILSLAETKAGTLATAAAQKVGAVATKVWAGAQWLMNTALLASPITWIVVGIVALIAVIVLIATKTNWFQRAWKVAWGGIKAAASNTWDFLKKIPGWIGTAFSKVSSAITGPFRTAFNYVARAWNNTIGQLNWTVPSWVPGIGGNSIGVPHLPTFHAGGVVPGVAGTPTVALLQAGEKVTSIAGSSGGGGGTVVLGSDGTQLGDLLISTIRSQMSRRGSRSSDLLATTGAVR